MKLIIGLGNPGPEYAKTRHNAGFMVIERLARRHGMLGSPVRSKFHAEIIEGVVGIHRVALLSPVTFMNRSGLTVGEAVAFYKVDPTQNLMIIVDDLALDVGRIRLRAEGSAGGHNGLADVQRALGSTAYPRLRVGIDSRGRVPQVDYVLGRFSPDQFDRLDPALDLACDAIESWLKHGIAKAMSLFNADKPEKA
ncbi:MAG: aminoacyl-tRNA hydrolase [Planctomycetota bacterium]|nr:aminoacyl-tRNA hydrolase [Planctomycetota bacterium]